MKSHKNATAYGHKRDGGLKTSKRRFVNNMPLESNNMPLISNKIPLLSNKMPLLGIKEWFLKLKLLQTDGPSMTSWPRKDDCQSEFLHLQLLFLLNGA